SAEAAPIAAGASARARANDLIIMRALRSRRGRSHDRAVRTETRIPPQPLRSLIVSARVRHHNDVAVEIRRGRLAPKPQGRSRQSVEEAENMKLRSRRRKSRLRGIPVARPIKKASSGHEESVQRRKRFLWILL